MTHSVSEETRVSNKKMRRRVAGLPTSESSSNHQHQHVHCQRIYWLQVLKLKVYCYEYNRYKCCQRGRTTVNMSEKNHLIGVFFGLIHHVSWSVGASVGPSDGNTFLSSMSGFCIAAPLYPYATQVAM